MFDRFTSDIYDIRHHYICMDLEIGQNILGFADYQHF